MINEILQWMVIIWLIWSTHNYGKAINVICNSLKEITKWEQDRLDKESNKPKKSFAVRMKEELKKDDML